MSQIYLKNGNTLNFEEVAKVEINGRYIDWDKLVELTANYIMDAIDEVLPKSGV